MGREKLDEFEPIFNPGSIAVVGVSENRRGPGTMYLGGLLEAGFRGKLYPVNPKGGRVLGLEVYPDLGSIPGAVDFVSTFIPKRLILDVLDDCAAKGVRVVQMFTAGFAEAGEEGCKLEGEVIARARKGGFRLVGPNCLGVYSPAHGMPLGPEALFGEAGTVGFICQSGGLAIKLLAQGMQRGIRFGKGVSFGNGSDLGGGDFLEYLAADPKTEIIACYLEGVRDGRRLYQLISETSRTKPVIVYSGGRTKVGAETARSHTGALAGSYTVWKAALRQAGAIQVDSLDELVDTVLALDCLPPLEGDGAVIISGLQGAGGGTAVVSADAWASQGLAIPPLGEETKSQLKAVLPSSGSIVQNPLDLGMLGGRPELLARVMELVTADDRASLILFEIHVFQLIRFLSLETIETIYDLIAPLVKFRKTQDKPVVVLSPPGLAEVERLALEKHLAQAGIPAYPSSERAARAIFKVSQYWRFRAQTQERS